MTNRPGEMIFTTSDLWSAFSTLTRAARCYMPSGPSIARLMDASITFTFQLAIDAAARNPVKTRDMERKLLSKLETWRAMKMLMMTHDVACVVETLERAARRYALPGPSSEPMVKYVTEILPRNLTIAAVAFTMQLAIEETACNAAELLALERALITKLEAPWGWKFGAIPAFIDVQCGRTWETQSEGRLIADVGIDLDDKDDE